MFRALLMFVVIAIANTSFAAEPLVLNSYADAYHAIKKHNVPGIFVFYADWCEPCKKMRVDTWIPLMSQLRKKYIVYFVNVDVEKTAMAQWHKKNPKYATALPAYVITTCTGDIIAYGEGYLDKRQWTIWANHKIGDWSRKYPGTAPPVVK